MQRLGTDDAAVFELGWPDLDRSFEPDHLTSLYLPDIGEPAAASMQRSVELTHRLRQDCPWDAEQTHGSLRRYLLEETYEVMEAIDKVERGDADGYEHLEEELGDLWFQILFHAELAAEAGEFTIADVAETSRQKLVGRHPHVFGDTEVADAAAVAANWEEIKKAEKGRSSVMEGIPDALPALAYAEKVLKKAAKAGATVRSDQSFSDADEAAAALLAIVAAGRANDLDLEGSLRAAAQRAKRRFEALERAAAASGHPIDPAENWLYG